MTTIDDPWRLKARHIVHHLSSDPDHVEAAAADGFTIEEVESGLLLARRGHAIGLIRWVAGDYAFIRAGNSAPTFRTEDVDELIVHLVEVVADYLRPLRSLSS